MYRDILTEQVREAKDVEGGSGLTLDSIFAYLPMALLGQAQRRAGTAGRATLQEEPFR